MKKITGNKEMSDDDAINEYYVRAKAKKTGFASAEAIELSPTESDSIDRLREKPLPAEVSSVLLKPPITTQEQKDIRNIINQNPEIKQTVNNYTQSLSAPGGSPWSNPMFLLLRKIMMQIGAQQLGRMSLLNQKLGSIKMPESAGKLEMQATLEQAGVPPAKIEEVSQTITQAKT